MCQVATPAETGVVVTVSGAKVNAATMPLQRIADPRMSIPLLYPKKLGATVRKEWSSCKQLRRLRAAAGISASPDRPVSLRRPGREARCAVLRWGNLSYERLAVTTVTETQCARSACRAP
jgi:hypothetical protein